MMCYFCRYWVTKNDLYGRCRRYPPTSPSPNINVIEESFPLTNATLWCGEFKEKE